MVTVSLPIAVWAPREQGPDSEKFAAIAGGVGARPEPLQWAGCPGPEAMGGRCHSLPPALHVRCPWRISSVSLDMRGRWGQVSTKANPIFM